MLRSLTQKVTVGSSLYLFLMVAVLITAVSVISMNAVMTAHLADDILPIINDTGDFNTALARAVSEAQLLSFTHSVADQLEIADAMKQAQVALENLRVLTLRSNANPAHTVSYTLLQQRRQELFALVQQQIRTMDRAVATNDPTSIVSTRIALSNTQEQFKQMDTDVDTITLQDTSATTTALTTRYQRVLIGGPGVILLLIVLLLIALWWLRSEIVVPVNTLALATTAVAQGQYDRPVAVTNTSEVGDLQRAFNAMLAVIRQQTEQLQQEVTRAKVAQASAETAQKQIEAQLATIASQQSVIQEMSVPIVPLTNTALVMPLIGALDTQRLSQVQVSALHALETAQARHLIIDITGVPVVDTPVAHGLLQVVAAARLLGTEVLMVGIRPEVAQSLVGLGIDLHGITTRSTLQSGVAYVLRHQWHTP